MATFDSRNRFVRLIQLQGLLWPWLARYATALTHYFAKFSALLDRNANVDHMAESSVSEHALV